jgi:hypothetical protein
MFFSPFDNLIFTIGPIFISLCFIFVFGMFIVIFITGIKQWNKNNHSPVLTVDATVVTKRSSVHRHNHHTNGSMHRSSSTTYYVTFEVQSGDRMELRVRGSEYGMLAEKDEGQLTFQGTRYLEFNRSKI